MTKHENIAALLARVAGQEAVPAPKLTVPPVIPLARPVSAPLDTAAWAQDYKLYCPGDIWLGRAPDESPVGVNNNQHILLDACSRGGKGVSSIIPNICEWPGSSVIIAPKGENAIVTARRRADGSAFTSGMGQKVCILDPFAAVKRDGDHFADLKRRFNPMDMINPDKPESVDEAARLAEAVIISENHNSDPYWEDAARELLKALILHVATSPDYSDDERHLVTVRKLLTSGEAEMKRLLEDNNQEDIPGSYDLLFEGMRRNPAFGGVVSRAGEQKLEQSEQSGKTLASVIQVGCTHTEFLDSPQLQEILTKSDFELSELKTDPNGMTLYLCLPQRTMETHHRWLRMMVSLILSEMERIPHQSKSGHPVLMVLDEFAGLKRMRVIENAAAQIAGFGVKMMFIVQTLAQLKSVYKENWETFLANTATKIFFGVDDHFTRDHVAKLMGECEVLRTAWNESQTTGGSHGVTHSTSTTKSTTFQEGGSSGSSGGSSASGGYGSWSSSRSWSQSTGVSRTTGHSTTDTTQTSATTGRTETIHKRPLVTASEIGRLFGDPAHPRSLVLRSGHQPVQITRRAYYVDPYFAGKFDPHPDHPKPPTLIARALEKHKKLNAHLTTMLARLGQVHSENEALTAGTIKQLENAESGRKAEYQALLRRLTWILPLSIITILVGVISFFIVLLVIAAEYELF